MSVPEFGITYIGRRLVFRFFLTLALVPFVVLLLFFLPLIAAGVVLVLWLLYLVLSYRSVWRYCQRVLAVVSGADV